MVALVLKDYLTVIGRRNAAAGSLFWTLLDRDRHVIFLCILVGVNPRIGR